MSTSQPVILIITTQTWLQLTRMALRFSRYGCKVSALCPAQHELRWLEHLHTCHSFKAGNPLGSLEAAIEESGASYLVPGDDLALWLLHELCERSPRHKKLVERSIGPARSFRTVRSRAGLLALATSLGIDVPQTAVTRTLAEAEAWVKLHKTPFVLKKDGSFGGGGVEIVTDAAALPYHYARLLARPTRWERVKQHLLPASNAFAASASWLASSSWISNAEISAQTYINGVAANAMFACDKGRILGSVQARVVAAKGKTGPAIMIDLLREEKIERAGALLAQSLGLSGFFGLDFILEEGTDTPYLIEMNPRCTQMGHVALAGQADLAGVLWAQWTGQELPAAGDRELTASVCFYPQAMAWGPDSRFLDHARLDVCAEDREVVDRLARGNPARISQAYRAARSQLVQLKRKLAPPGPAPIHYFAAASADRQVGKKLEHAPAGFQNAGGR